MKIIMPSFGFMSVIANSTIFLPHALFLLGVILLHGKEAPLFFLFFTVLARVIGDWLFWKRFFPTEMDSGENFHDWRLSVKGILTSQSAAIKSMIDLVIDAITDVALVYLAFRASAPLMWILFTFSACQAVGAPIQGMIIHFFEKQNVRIFSMLITALATFLALEINGITPAGYVNAFGLSYFSPSIQICIVLGAKCLLAGTSVVAKATIAEVIKIETIKNSEKYGVQPNGN